MRPDRPNSIGLLGLGEVGRILATDIHALTGGAIKAYDILFDDAQSAPSRAAVQLPGVVRCESALELVTGCDLLISVVTAARDLDAAQSVVAALDDGTWFLDLNSVAPTTKMAVADVIETAGGRYVEGAVMSSIEPQRSASPILLGGPHAQLFADVAIDLGFTGARAFSDSIGPASATKMCRSVVVKGIESLLTESLLAARHYGVEDDVLTSLRGLANNDDWEGFARYMISRSLLHGARRAEEMREVANTVGDAGIEPLMSSACALRQDRAASFAATPGDDQLIELLDRMRMDTDKIAQ